MWTLWATQTSLPSKHFWFFWISREDISQRAPATDCDWKGYHSVSSWRQDLGGGFIAMNTENSTRADLACCIHFLEAKLLAHSGVIQPIWPSDSPRLCEQSGAVRLGHENWRNLNLKYGSAIISSPLRPVGPAHMSKPPPDMPLASSQADGEKQTSWTEAHRPVFKS